MNQWEREEWEDLQASKRIDTAEDICGWLGDDLSKYLPRIINLAQADDIIVTDGEGPFQLSFEISGEFDDEMIGITDVDLHIGVHYIKRDAAKWFQVIYWWNGALRRYTNNFELALEFCELNNRESEECLAAQSTNAPV